MDMIENLAEKEGLTKIKAKAIVQTVLDSIKQGVAEDGIVQIRNFGTFRKVEKPEREVRCPANGKTMLAKASNAVKFKVSKGFTDSLN